MLRRAEDELETLRDDKSRLETQLGLAVAAEEKAKSQLKMFMEGEGERMKEELETVKSQLEDTQRGGLETETMWKEKVAELQQVSYLSSPVLHFIC